MEIGTQVSIPKALQHLPGDDKRYLIYLGVIVGKHRFSEHQTDGTPMKSSWALNDDQMKRYFPDYQKE